MLPPVTSTLKFPEGTHLITAGIVMAVRGLSVEAITNAVDSGELQFVWNISARPSAKISVRRFWLREVLDPPAVARLTPRAVVASILGEQRSQWRGTQVAQLLLCSRPTIHRLHQSRALRGVVKGNVLWIARPALEKFLFERLVGSPP